MGLGEMLGINHQSPLIYWSRCVTRMMRAGNQSPIPFDILYTEIRTILGSWESITNPL